MLVAFVGCVLLVTAAAVAWNNGIGEQIFPKRWVDVAPGFYRSAQLHPRLIKRVLEERQVRVIVDLTDPDLSRATQRAEQEASAELGISHHRFPLDGNGLGDIQHYADAIEVIADARENEEPVLVHCSAGARRVGGVVASYQLLVEGKDPEAAYAELDRYGRTPVAETPLVAFLNENMGTLADELVSRGVLDRAPRPLPVFVPSN
ncbi:MAG: hypothetical protein VX574_11765 [Myxococcota bacterium]|nr:hypothetical protein [Myxococcota bacterium]